jgi:biopolymer transport protein ExbB
MGGETIKTALERFVLDGGPLMAALIPCSLLAVGFIIRGLLNLRVGVLAPAATIQRLRDSDPDQMDYAVAALSAEAPCALTRLLERALRKIRAGRFHGEDTLAELVAEEIAVLYQRNNQLAVIYTVAPLLGLLGTVLGMMTTFFRFSQSSEPSVAELAVGFNQALVTTMWGLSIAVPSYVFLAIFRNRLFRYSHDLLPGLVNDLLDPAIPAEED